MLTIETIFFIAFALFTVISAIMVVLSKNPIYSILYLILTMFSLSGHYILLHAQFISVVNIIVYAGAIMVLFLFVLMLLNLSRDAEPNKSSAWKLMSVCIGLVFSIVALLIYDTPMTLHSAIGVQLPVDFGLVKPLGKLLFTQYVFPFEVASILFIAAIVGIVFLGGKEIKKA